MLSILHILPNEKFSPINVFDGVEANSEYYCPLAEGDNLRYLDSSRVQTTTIQNLCDIVAKKRYDIIIFHSLPNAWYRIVLSVRQEAKVVWAVFGFDMYYADAPYRPICEMQLYQPITERWLEMRASKPLRKRITRAIKNVFHYPAYKEQQRELACTVEKAQNIQNQVLERIDYCAPIFENEVELLKTNPHFHAALMPIQYTRWSKDDNFESHNLHDATYIQLGNSADPSGNIVDVLDVLQKRKINNTVYLPMAYGEEDYKQSVVNYVNEHKVDAIVQDKMIQFDEYTRIMRNCRVSVFGHIRQQASDSIHMSLLRGNKVFLYKDSVGYQYYKQKGFYVYTIEEDLTSANIQELLTPEQIQHNIDLVLQTVSEEEVTKRVAKTLKEIENA